MSIDVMTRVWANSKQKGSALLLMVSIADYANEKGIAYPSIETLARKVRMSERNVQLLLRKCEVAGELEIKINAGPSGSNIYRIIYPGPNGGENFSPQGEEDCTGGVKAASPGGEKSRAKGVKAASPDPSVDPPIDPSKEEITRDAEQPTPSLSSSTQPATVAPSEPEPKLATAPFVAPSENYAKVRAVYEQNFSLLTSILSERIKEALRKYPVEWVMLAMERAVTAEKRRWDYVEGILRNWESEGFNNARPRKANAVATGGNAVGHRTDSAKPWADYQRSEFDEESAAILNSH